MMIEKIFHITAVTVYILTLSALGLYGLNFLYLTAIAGKNRRYLPKYFLDVPLPKVTVQLPIFNEYNVVERIINAAARLDWPSDLFEIQVLDDSTDATCDLARQAVAYWHARGVHIQHIHRKNREGYKSGALANGLLTSTGEFIAIFDADFIPEPDFLYKTIGAFSNPDVGCVQARWTHINGDSSLLTCLQRLGIDGHFMIEQFARAYAGFVMNFNGTGGVWRRTAIEDVGGWNFKSITEDLDLSYRSALKGWKMVYLPNVPVPSELVPSLLAYRRQQRRWAHGSADCAKRFLPKVINSQLPNPVKIEAVFHLTGYFIQFFMLVASLLYPLIMLIAHKEAWETLLSTFGVFLIPVALAPTILFLTAQWFLNPHGWWREIPFALVLSILGAGMMVNNTFALWQGLCSHPISFDRTPKWGGQNVKKYSVLSFPYLVPKDSLVIIEILLAGFNAFSVYQAWRLNNIGILITTVVLTTGLAAVSGMTIWEMIVQAYNNKA